MLLFMCSSTAFAQTHWVDLSTEARAELPLDLQAMPSRFRVLSVDVQAMKRDLAAIRAKSGAAPTIIALPSPDGGSRRFVVKRSGVLPDALAQKYPDIQAYQGFAADDPTITVRFELTERGLSAQVLEPGARWMIDPKPSIQKGLAISFFTGDTKRPSHAGVCELETGRQAPIKSARGSLEKKSLAAKPAAKSSGTTLRTYRIAVAATGEYGEFHVGQGTTPLSAVTTTINRVTGILEKEMSVSLQLVSNNDLILYEDRLTDPFNGNSNASVLINESQDEIDAVIGESNYDIGHTFSTGAGGLASLGSVCVSGEKARGVTGSSTPRGEYYDVDFVAHEIGHQLGGNHTFNGTNGSCTGGNRNWYTAYEPGSGSTIQAYPSLCGADDLQSAVDPIYHSISFDEMYGYVSDGDGASCGIVTTTNNTPPTVTAGSDYAVPAKTPMVISGAGSDAEQSNITYLWEQRDLGPQAALAAPDDGEIPLFRVLTPSLSATRYLPSMSAVLSGNYSNQEKIPQLGRELDMRLTARDGQGGVAYDEMVISVIGTAGPFAITSPNGGESVGASKTITWDVAATNQAPISTAQVEILLSTDGGQNFDRSLGITANDGAHSVSFPSGLASNRARIMVKAVDNIYYDVSDSDFVLDADRVVPPAPTSASVSATDGGAVVSFSPGEDNGVSITSYSAMCIAEENLEVFSQPMTEELPFDDTTPLLSELVFSESVIIEAGELQIPVDITHTWRDDINLVLTSPQGTETTLITGGCTNSSPENLTGVFPTTLAVEESLDAYVGENAQGTWSLAVTDECPLDEGTFNSWGIVVTKDLTPPDVSVSGATSPLTLSGMTNGQSYACQVTAYSGSDPSETVFLDAVIPGSVSSADADDDGVPDDDDAFPNDPAASVDTDGDGMPDDWNPAASDADIEASQLVVDEDDDNDGYSDQEEVEAGTSPTNAGDSPIMRSRVIILKGVIDATGG